MHEEIAQLLDDLNATADKCGDEVYPIVEPMRDGSPEPTNRAVMSPAAPKALQELSSASPSGAG